MSYVKIEAILLTKFPRNIITELLDSYKEQKRNYFLGNHRPTEVEGGRFSEAAFRMLEHAAGWSVTPIGTQLNTNGIITRLGNLPAVGTSDSVRLHIPRTLRVIYDIRNQRDVAHLADGIDPNLQDSSFVFAALDWVLAEFIRYSGGGNPTEAYNLIKGITIHAIPAVEDFGGFLKTLNPKLTVSERILLLLYHQGNDGANYTDLSSWVKPEQRTNLKRTLTQLKDDKDFVVFLNSKYQITRLGVLEVQNKKLVEL